MQPTLADHRESDEVSLASPCQDEHRELVLLWCAGIGVAYAFLVFFVCWVGYRVFLLYGAYRIGDLAFIRLELSGWAIVAGAYFGAAILLRKLGIL